MQRVSASPERVPHRQIKGVTQSIKGVCVADDSLVEPQYEPQPNPSAPLRVKTVKACRLPENWNPDEAALAFAAKHVPDPQATLETFRDYWAGAPGAKGLKQDWPGTWRNWCRREGERSGGRGNVVQMTGKVAVDGDPYGAEAWAKTLQDATEAEGKLRLGGYNGRGIDAAGWATDLCDAAGMDPSRVAGGLGIVAEWLREHKVPYWIEDLIKRARKPAGGVKSLEYFRQPVADQAARDRGERQEALL